MLGSMGIRPRFEGKGGDMKSNKLALLLVLVVALAALVL